MLRSRHLACLAIALAVGAVVHGCNTSGHGTPQGNTGNRLTNPTYFVPVGGSAGTSTITSDIVMTAPANPPGAGVGGVNVHAMTLRWNNNGTTAASIASFKLTASGTVDESVTLIKMSIIHDLNSDGIVGVGEPTLVSTSPAFPTNDGTVTITPQPPLSIAPNGGQVQLMITVDLVTRTGLKDQHPLCGQTIDLSVASAQDVIVLQGAIPFAPSGNFPLQNQTLGISIGGGLLISEVSYANDAEFIEFFNPTAGPAQVSLLTDYTQDNPLPVGSQPRFYFLRPQVPFEFGPPNPQVGRDFSVQLQVLVPPGGFAIVAIDGVKFAASFPNITPGATLRNPGTGLIWDPTANNNAGAFVQGQVGPDVDLNDGGEGIWAYSWDGTSDNIRDIDIVGWGTQNAQGNEAMVNKNGKATDGPDGNNTQTPFAPETNATVQEQARVPLVGVNSGQSMQRFKYDEITPGGRGETPGGNGASGQDETSERWDQTFKNASVTPGAAEP